MFVITLPKRVYIYLCVYFKKRTYDKHKMLIAFYFGETDSTVESLCSDELSIELASRQCCSASKSSIPLDLNFVTSFSFY